MILITDKLILFNSTGHQWSNLDHFDLLKSSSIDLYPILSRSISIDNQSKIDAHRDDNKQLINLSLDNCVEKLILTFLVDHLYWMFRFSLKPEIKLDHNRTIIANHNPSDRLLIVDDCNGTKLLWINQTLMVMIENEQKFFNVCVRRAQFSLFGLEIGITEIGCENQQETLLIFSKIQQGFRSSRTQQIYLLSSNYLLIFSAKIFRTPNTYDVLLTRQLNEWFDCGDLEWTQKRILDS